MGVRTAQKPETISHSDKKSSSRSQSGGTATFQFQDNRSEASMIQKIQGASDNTPHSKQLTQLKSFADNPSIQKQKNTTGLPDNLKSGVENLSGYSLNDVKVHYNSGKPAQMQAHAYAQGTDIHVAPGQEKHLAHEAWHVVQQKQGRVGTTAQMKGGIPINDDAGLEKEADVMGAKSMSVGESSRELKPLRSSSAAIQTKLIQRYSYSKGTTRIVNIQGASSKTRSFEECTYNSVEFKSGEKKPTSGTTTGTAAWEGWLKNKSNDNNATQLHVVNRRWGGLGGKDDGNIVPGTPAENSHHLHQGEKKFDECFDSSNKAINDCKYECTATPKYGTSVDISGGDKQFGDPTLSVKITDNGIATTYPITDGSEGLVFKTGS